MTARNLAVAGATTGLAITLFGLTGPAFASPSAPATPDATPVATTQPVEKDDDGDAGLWGLTGLLGLAGLAGLAKRPKEVVHAAPARTADRTHTVDRAGTRVDGTANPYGDARQGGVDGNPNTRV